MSLATGGLSASDVWGMPLGPLTNPHRRRLPLTRVAGSSLEACVKVEAKLHTCTLGHVAVGQNQEN